jgi:hypothetical protein
MIDTKTIKKMARGILKQGNQRASDHRIMHPQREWFICLGVGLIAFGISVTWSIQLYKSYSDVVFESSIDQEGAAVYRTGDVDSALQLFTDRATRYETLKNDLTLARSVSINPIPALPADPEVSTEEGTSTASQDLPAEVIPDTAVSPVLESSTLELF